MPPACPSHCHCCVMMMVAATTAAAAFWLQQKQGLEQEQQSWHHLLQALLCCLSLWGGWRRPAGLQASAPGERRSCERLPPCLSPLRVGPYPAEAAAACLVEAGQEKCSRRTLTRRRRS